MTEKLRIYGIVGEVKCGDDWNKMVLGYFKEISRDNKLSTLKRIKNQYRNLIPKSFIEDG